MNFQELAAVETPQFYLDVAFRRAKKQSMQLRQQTKARRLEKSRKIDCEKVEAVRHTIDVHFKRIIASFPSLDDLPEFYKELIRCTLDYGEIKKSLGAVSWCRDRINSLARDYSGRIRKCTELKRINAYRSEFFGRVSSLVEQIGHQLEYLEASRRTMKGFPAIKTKLFTAALFGFPNVGKTTLLSKLTGSTPEIKAYAFTTKNINIGYLKHGHSKIQVLDTPGTLNRFEKMNFIEKQAYLALKYCTDAVIYVFDLTEASNSIAEQKKLYQQVVKHGLPVLIYLSKTDMLQNVSFPLEHCTIEKLADKVTSLAAAAVVSS